MATGRNVQTAERRREHWGWVLRQWRASGLTQAEFCRRRGIPVGNFSWWKCRMGSRPLAAPAEFVPLGVLTRAPQQSRLEVVLSNGRRLRFGVEVDPGHVSRLVAALDGAGKEAVSC